MSIQTVIEQKLSDSLDLDHLEVINESGNHNVPAGSESHFKVTLVSKAFEPMKLIQRHKRVNEILKHELAHDIHALAMHTYTSGEWQKRHGETPMSPPCLGGSASEA
ncbi:MAG: BolA protein [Candidatus Azotimanducaceae bacterium]|jgi:BolA protein